MFDFALCLVYTPLGVAVPACLGFFYADCASTLLCSLLVASKTDRVRNEVLLHGVKEARNFRRTVKRRKANCIVHILHRNCLLNHIIEGKLEVRIDVTGRRGRRLRQLRMNLREVRRYWKLKEEALDHTVWRTRFGRG